MRHWRNSFVTRLAGLFALLTVALVLVNGWLRDWSSRARFLQDQRRHLAHRVEIIRVRVQCVIDAVPKDILYLSRAPVIGRLADAKAEQERDAALREAAVHFKALLEVRPTYFQARLIGVADGGREIIRFDKIEGRIQEVPPNELQRKGDRDYFRETVKLPPGSFYLSEINLNQEFGKISHPSTPTLRATMPIFDAVGGLFGIVILNMDVTQIFNEVRSLAGPDVVVTLCNSQGDYLLHPEPAKCFGFDRGQRFRLFDDHPNLWYGVRNEQAQDDESELAITEEFPFTLEAHRSLILRLALPKAPLLAHLQARRARNFALTGVLATVAVAVVIGVANLLARRLRLVTEAVERYQPGQALPGTPWNRPDEVGLLTCKFHEMAAKISEQMQSLRDAQQRAETAMRSRDEFFATMSHEIRTPMNAVLGMAHLLESEAIEPRQAERLRALKFAGRHLMALLNNLLDRNRIESGEIVFDNLDFDLGDLLANLRCNLEVLAGRKGLDFVLELDPAARRWVQGDPVRLYQVMNNLVHNAIKFTVRGKVVVHVAACGTGKVNFRISDTGPGLPPRVLESLRACSAPTPAAGLGLRISRQLIEMLGGHLEAQSTPAGTALSFSLHLSAAHEASAAHALEQPPDFAGYSALVVEDVTSNQTVLGALLEKTDMTIDFVTTAAQAQERLKHDSYDFAFVDIQLPDANGVELSGALLRMRPDLRVVAVTAQVSREVRSACATVGVHEFVPKPVEPAELYEKLLRLTSPQVESVLRLFDHAERKVCEYFAQFDRECQLWEAELRSLIASPDAEQLRRLHHRMKNALGQLGLWKLDRTLGALCSAMGGDEQESIRQFGEIALRLIAAVRQFTGDKAARSSLR